MKPSRPGGFTWIESLRRFWRWEIKWLCNAGRYRDFWNETEDVTSFSTEPTIAVKNAIPRRVEMIRQTLLQWRKETHDAKKTERVALLGVNARQHCRFIDLKEVERGFPAEANHVRGNAGPSLLARRGKKNMRKALLNNNRASWSSRHVPQMHEKTSMGVVADAGHQYGQNADGQYQGTRGAWVTR